MIKTKIVACVAAAAFAAVLGLAGCSNNSQGSSNDSKQDSAASAPAATAAATSPEASAPAQGSTAAPADTSAAPAPADTTAAPAPAPAQTQNEYIGDEAAKAIALEHAGIAQADCTELKSELDLDDAIIHYDVDFKAGGLEYDYDIDATTGEILTHHSEVDD